MKSLYTTAGNIAAGKSLLLDRLRDTGAFTIIPEPVEEWRTGYADNFLQLYYDEAEAKKKSDDSNRWAFPLQILAFVTRVRSQEKALAKGPGRYVMERSIWDDRRIFARLLCESGDMRQSEYQLYCDLWDYMSQRVVKPGHVFYLRTPADECLKRIAQRGRPEEAGIELAFLEKIQVLYDEWLLEREGVTVLNGLKSTDELVADVVRAVGVEVFSDREDTFNDRT